jgi:hypothetical protein
LKTVIISRNSSGIGTFSATTPEGLRRRKEERLRLEKQERQAKWDALSDADKALLIAWAEAEADADT